MLIGIVGQKGSGKDTFAGFLPGFRNVKFADPLKDMMRTLLSFDSDADVEAMVEGDLKELPAVVLCHSSPRHAMQTLGTEWRDLIDRHLWSNIFRTRVAPLLKEGTPVVCTDVRFLHEADLVRNMGGSLIRVTRDTGTNDPHHLSEQELEKICVDETIQNNGSISDLRLKATKFLQEKTT